MKKNESWGLFSGEEWQHQYGSGSKKAMSCILEIARRNGLEDLELRKFSHKQTDHKETVFSSTLEKFGITCYKISKETGVNASTVQNWKAKRFRPDPYDDNYKKVVDYIEKKTGVTLSLMDFVK